MRPPVDEVRGLTSVAGKKGPCPFVSWSWSAVIGRRSENQPWLNHEGREMGNGAGINDRGSLRRCRQACRARQPITDLDATPAAFVSAQGQGFAKLGAASRCRLKGN